jgi:hypothetical protein
MRTGFSRIIPGGGLVGKTPAMKVLLIHPDDSPLAGAWRGTSWDYVVDMGWAGPRVYEQWEAELGCPVRALYGLSQETGILEIRDFLAAASQQFVDEEGLDWWEILAPLRYLQVFELLLTLKLSKEIAGAKLTATSSHRLLPILSRVFGQKIRCFNPTNRGVLQDQLRRFTKAAWILSPSQIVDVAFDKWDPNYRLRARFSRRNVAVSRAARILIPSAYGNVSRVVNSYASLLPEREFLLVATRRSGETGSFSKNVSVAKLADYASTEPSAATKREIKQLRLAWKQLSTEAFQPGNGLHRALELGLFDDFSVSLERGLRIRDTWRRVFDAENISAVCCGDENNSHVRVPVLLARLRGVPTFYFDHGALNALLPLRSLACDTYVAKGEMERDYMIERCAVPASRIVVGAPAGRATAPRESDGLNIVFFSEQYELFSGRTRSFYGEILPRLCALARHSGRRVIVKLHPFESLRARTRTINQTVSREDRELIDIAHGPLTAEIMRGAWFALTVESSVAVECTMHSVPCFLCGWFELSFAGYAKQYVKFGAARRLNSPEEIATIPDHLQHYSITPEIQDRLWHPMSPRDLDEMLFQTTDPQVLQERRTSVAAPKL